MKENRFAVLIGIDDYEVTPLNFCTKDVKDMRDCFNIYSNVSNENIFTICSTYNQPVSNILSSFETIFKRIGAKFIPNEDSLFFYFSGHGIKTMGGSTTLAFQKESITLEYFF